MKVLFCLSPMTQLNTPYPSTAYLTGFCRSRGIDAVQCDLSIELAHRVFSADAVEAVGAVLSRHGDRPRSAVVQWFARERERIGELIPRIVSFLSGGDSSFAASVARRGFLPEGPRFRILDEFVTESSDPLDWAFGSLGAADRTKFMASLFLEDFSNVVTEVLDPRFDLVRYADSLGDSQPSFEPLLAALRAEPTWVDQELDRLVEAVLLREQPGLLGISVPFPGNVYGAFRVAATARRLRPELPIVLGGGWVNTELRSLREPRVFDYVDAVLLDDGERPLECFLEHLAGERRREDLFRTFVREGSEVRWISSPAERDVRFSESGTPTYDGLPLRKYLQLPDSLNPMQRLWTEHRWNKATVSHGCYWKKCSFCDVGLDYIGRYDPASAEVIVDRMAALVRETGDSGFHFVDEAAPPGLLRLVAEELLRRRLSVTWWGNIRFERSFTSELSALLARSGCIAVTGGLEVASDRLLARMSKGVTIEQVARVSSGFVRAGILVHAYLMYGFPGQTLQETVDSLEVVRQLFETGCISSAYWHRFYVSVHSPIGQDPASFGIRLLEPDVRFSVNGVPHVDPDGVDPDLVGPALGRALHHYQHGFGLDVDVHTWFAAGAPATTIPRDRVARALEAS